MTDKEIVSMLLELLKRIQVLEEKVKPQDGIAFGHTAQVCQKTSMFCDCDLVRTWIHSSEECPNNKEKNEPS